MTPTLNEKPSTANSEAILGFCNRYSEPEAAIKDLQRGRGAAPLARAVSRFTVVHVDDDPDDAFFVQRAFLKSDLGVTLHHVADGPTVLAYLEGEGVYCDRLRFPLPSLMLLDIKLPGMDGFDILSWVRHNEEFSGVTVFMLSSSGHDWDRTRAQELGADLFFVKSLTFTDVIETIRLMLPEKGGGACKPWNLSTWTEDPRAGLDW